MNNQEEGEENKGENKEEKEEEKLTQKEEKEIALGKFTYGSIVVFSVLSIPAMVAVVSEANHPCQRGEFSPDMKLSDWLEGFVIEKFISLGLTTLLLGCFWKLPRRWLYVAWVGIFDFTFSVVWTILGTAILISHHGRHCVDEKMGIGVMSVFLVCLTVVSSCIWKDKSEEIEDREGMGAEGYDDDYWADEMEDGYSYGAVGGGVIER